MSVAGGNSEPTNSNAAAQSAIEAALAAAARRRAGAPTSPPTFTGETVAQTPRPELGRAQIQELGSRVVSVLSSFPERAPLVTINDVRRQTRGIPLTDVVWRFSERIQRITQGWILHPAESHPRTPQEGFLPGTKYAGALLATDNTLYEFKGARGRDGTPYDLFMVSDSWNPSELGGSITPVSYETTTYRPDELQTAMNGLLRHCNLAL